MRPFPLVQARIPVLLFFAWGCLSCLAQGKRESLTRDFASLPAKERSRIAAREAEEARQDTLYQRLMREGDLAFQAGHYNEALDTFRKARELRPYNVYPKVKIEDLQALIRKREAAVAAEAAPPVELPEAVPAKPEPEAVVADPPDAPAPKSPSAAVQEDAPAPQPAASPPVAPAPDTQPAVTQRPPATPVKADPPPPLPPLPMAEEQPVRETGSRVYLQAGAVVTENSVEENGKVVVYKRVAHPWGQTFYFKDGLDMTAREWEARFTEAGR